MFPELLKSKESLAALILRFGLAAIFIVHGFIKATVDLELAPSVMSMTAQRIIGWVELLCGLLLFAGALTRIAAAVVVVLQIAAIAMVTGQYAMIGVRISRHGADYMLVGPEYNLVLIAMALCLLFLGAGAVSVDRIIREKRAGAKAAGTVPTTAAPTVVPAPAPGTASADKPADSVPAA